MLGTYLVVDAVVATLEDAPKALDPVRVYLPANVPPCRVRHYAMRKDQAPLGAMVVAVDDGVRRDVLKDGSVHDPIRNFRHGHGAHFTAALKQSKDRRLAGNAAALRRSLVLAHVAHYAAYVSLVYLDGA